MWRRQFWRAISLGTLLVWGHWSGAQTPKRPQLAPGEQTTEEASSEARDKLIAERFARCWRATHGAARRANRDDAGGRGPIRPGVAAAGQTEVIDHSVTCILRPSIRQVRIT